VVHDVTRFSHQVPGVSHDGRAAAVAQIGPFFASSMISPLPPGAAAPAGDVDGQVSDLFTMIERHLTHAGVDWDDVAKLDFYLADGADPEAIDAPWLEQFPHDEMRPARQVHIEAQLPDGMQVAATFLAYRRDP